MAPEAVALALVAGIGLGCALFLAALVALQRRGAAEDPFGLR